jgi:hypothetical protein
MPSTIRSASSSRPWDEQPPRALRHVPAHEQDPEPEQRAHGERQAPAEVAGEHGGVQEPQRGDAADRRADPVAAVDRDVDLTAVARRDQLVDGGVDRRVLTADSGAGEEAAEVEVPGRERERGADRRQDVERQRDHHQLLAPEAIGELAEEQRADARATDVDRRRRPDPGRADVDPAAVLGQPGTDRADDRHLEPVEDPHRPQAGDDPPVEARPREAIESRWDLRADRSQVRGAGHRGAFRRCRRRPTLTFRRTAGAVVA